MTFSEVISLYIKARFHIVTFAPSALQAEMQSHVEEYYPTDNFGKFQSH